jgi:hypothetical protein
MVFYFEFLKNIFVLPRPTANKIYTAQKWPCVRLVSLMQRKNILFMTDTIGAALFLADFCALSTFASLEYMEYAGMLFTLLIAYSSDASVDNT